MEYYFRIHDEDHTLHVEWEGDVYCVSIDGAAPRTVQFTRDDAHTLSLQLGNTQRRAHVARGAHSIWVALGADVYELQVVERRQSRRPARVEADSGSLHAQMPGQVVSVDVQAGDTVAKGQTLVILEAMKMEVRVQAPYAGRIQRVVVQTGQVVERGQQLVEMEPP